VLLNDKPVYAYSSNGQITHYRLSGSSKNIGPFKAYLLGIPSRWADYALATILGLLPVTFLLLRPQWFRSVVPLLVLCILVSGIIVDMRYRVTVLRRVMSRVNTKITSTYSTHYADEVAFQAQKLTPKNALFLTPPAFGRFRLLAGRAIVVDFKSFPFQDAAMLEWRSRLQDCYGMVEKIGFAAAREMDVNYRSIPEQRVFMLARKYGINYAALYRVTDCKLPVIFENRVYKIVKVSSEDQQGQH